MPSDAEVGFSVKDVIIQSMKAVYGDWSREYSETNLAWQPAPLPRSGTSATSGSSLNADDGRFMKIVNVIPTDTGKRRLNSGDTIDPNRPTGL